MKKMNKKGFTIVELVIVIAVIAILAAVLIPTFQSVITKAKKSSAQQEAKVALDVVTAETEGQVTGTYYFKSGDYYFSYTKGNKKLQEATSSDFATGSAYNLSGEASSDVPDGVTIAHK